MRGRRSKEEEDLRRSIPMFSKKNHGREKIEEEEEIENSDFFD
jgi:hypothetical protein